MEDAGGGEFGRRECFPPSQGSSACLCCGLLLCSCGSLGAALSQVESKSRRPGSLRRANIWHLGPRQRLGGLVRSIWGLQAFCANGFSLVECRQEASVLLCELIRYMLLQA